MNNNELQLTDSEQQVLKYFCESYCKYKMRHDPPLPILSVKDENLKALESLEEKGLVKLVQRFYKSPSKEIIPGIVGYIPTEKLKNTKLYKRIDNFVKFGNRYPRKEK